MAEAVVEPPLPELAQVLNQAALTLAQEKHQAIIHTQNGPAFSPTTLTSAQVFNYDLELTRTFARGSFSRTSLAAEGKKLVQYTVDALHQKGTTNWEVLISQIDQLVSAPVPLLQGLRIELELGRTLAESPELTENPQAFLAFMKDQFLDHQATMVSRSRKGNQVLSCQGKGWLHAAYNWQRRLFGSNDAYPYQSLKAEIATAFSGGGVERLARASLLGKLRWEETLTAYQILEQQLPEDLKIRGDEPLKGAAFIQSRLKQALTQVEAELGYPVNASEVITRYETELARAAELEAAEARRETEAFAALPQWRRAWIKLNPVKSLKQVAYALFSGLAISTMLINPMAALAKDLGGETSPHGHSQPDADPAQTPNVTVDRPEPPSPHAVGKAADQVVRSVVPNLDEVQSNRVGRATDQVVRVEKPVPVMMQPAPIQEPKPSSLIGPTFPDAPEDGANAPDHQLEEQVATDQAPEPSLPLLVRIWQFLSQPWKGPPVLALANPASGHDSENHAGPASQALTHQDLTPEVAPSTQISEATQGQGITFLAAEPESAKVERSQTQIDQFHQALTNGQAQIVIHGGPHLNDLDPSDQVFRAPLKLSVPIGPGDQYPERPADSLHIHPIDARVVNPAAAPTTDPTPVTAIQVQGAEGVATLQPSQEVGRLGNTFVVPIENVVQFQANPDYQGIITLDVGRALQVGNSVTVTTPQGDLTMEVVAKTSQESTGSLNEALQPLNLDATELTLVITNCGEPEVVGDRLTNTHVDRVIVVLQPAK